MADKQSGAAAVKDQTPVELPSADINLLQSDAVIIINALGIINIQHMDAAMQHQREIDNPSLMNPQPAMHEAKRDELLASINHNTALIERIAETFGIDLAPQPVVVLGEASGVEGPAEHNRPNQARPGLGNSTTV